MGIFNKLVGGPKWVYEGIKGEVIDLVGGAGNYVVDSVSDITVGAGQAVEDVGANIGKGIGSLIEYPVTAVTKPVGQLGKDLTIPLLIGAAFLLLKK